jgi:hypothetical protein
MVAATLLPRWILGNYVIGVGARTAWWGRARLLEGRARRPEGRARMPEGRARPLRGAHGCLMGAHGPVNTKP